MPSNSSASSRVITSQPSTADVWQWLVDLWRRLMGLRLRVRFAAPAAPSNSAPTAINFSGLSHADNAAAGTVVASFTIIDADSATMNSVVCSNSKYEIANLSGKTGDLVVSAAGAGNFTPGTESTTVTATDSSGNPYTSGSQTITVADHTAATLVWTQSLKNDSGSTASGQRIRFTGGALEGVILDTSVLELRKNDGTTAITRQQFDAISYHDDGSVRFFVCTFEQQDNIAGSGTDTVKVYNAPTTAASNTSAITDQNIKDLNYTVEIDATGGTYTFDVDDAFTAGDVEDFAIGPVERQVHVWGKPKLTGTPNDNILVKAWIGLNRDGTTSHAWADVVGHWNENYSSIAGAGIAGVTAWRIKKNGSTVKEYTRSAYDQGAGVRVAICETDATACWSANKPTVRPTYTVAQRHNAGMIPDQAITSSIQTTLGDPSPDVYTPLDILSFLSHVDSSGARREIGWMNHADAVACQTQTKNWCQTSRAWGLAGDPLKKSFFEAATGHPPAALSGTYGTLTGHSSFTVYNENGMSGSSPYDANSIYHMQAGSYVPYLDTGEPWWADRVETDATHSMAVTPTGVRSQSFPNGDTRTVVRIDGGPRGFAWGYRSQGQARWILPDTNIMRPYIDHLYDQSTLFLNSCGKAANFYGNSSTLKIPLKLVETNHDINGDPAGNGNSTRWFQWFYLAIVTGHEAFRGTFDNTSEWWGVMDTFVLGMGIDGCASKSFAYTANFEHQNGTTGESSACATSWANVAIPENWPSLGGAYDDWSDDTKLIPSGGCPSSGAWVSGQTTTTYYGGGSYPACWHKAAKIWQEVGLSRVNTYETYLANMYTADNPTDWGDSAQMHV